MKQKLGKVSISPKGEWNSATAYECLDTVNFGGGSWLAKRANTAVSPIEGDDWMQLSAKGADAEVTKDSIVEALGYEPASGEWELLNTLTTTEEIVCVNITKDSAGNTLRLSKAFGIVSLPTKKTIGKIYLGEYFRWIAIPCDFTAQSMHLFMEAMGDRFRGYAQQNALGIETENMSDYAKMLWGCGSNKLISSGAITSVAFFNQYYWDVGTKFLVYGIRAT